MIVVYVVDDAVVSHAEATCGTSLELAALPRTRVFGEIFYRRHYSIVNRLGQAGYGLAGLPFDDNLIAHRVA
jgi:hypothetical protein